jgi:hypothetical protein
MTNEKRIPKKGAAKKWSQRLKDLGKQSPPKDLVEKIRRKSEDEQAARPSRSERDADI